MKYLLLAIGILAYSFSSFSQTTEIETDLKSNEKNTLSPFGGWYFAGATNLTFSQVSLTNWAGGGENSISANGYVNLTLNYTKGRGFWDNDLETSYGILRQGDYDFFKSDDKFDFTTKYGHIASKRTYYAALVNVRTQLTKGYNSPTDSVYISRFMAPGYILSAIGFDHKRNKNFNIFFAPLTSKITVVNDTALSNAGAFGVEEGELYRSEFGGYLRILIKKEIVKNVNLQTKVDLFSNYLFNPQNIDVNWETFISMKINSHITANINFHLIYDDDIDIEVDTDDDGIADKYGPRVQLKEVFGVGFAYQFDNSEKKNKIEEPKE